MRKKPLRPPKDGDHDVPGAGPAALDQPKPGEDNKMNIINPNATIEKAPGPVSGGLADAGQVALEPASLAGIKFDGLGEYRGPTKDEWQSNLVQLRMMFQVLKYDDEGLAERVRVLDDPAVFEEIVENLIDLKDRMDCISEMAEAAMARVVAAVSRVCVEGEVSNGEKKTDGPGEGAGQG